MEDTLELEENHTMPAKAALYFMENNLHLNDDHNDDSNEEKEEEEPNSNNWMRGVHLLETNEELANHPSIEQTEEISRNEIGSSELFGTTNANRDHNRIELLHSLQMGEKGEILDDLIDNTALDHAATNVIQTRSLPDWELTVTPTPELDLKDVTTGVDGTETKLNLINLLTKHKKILPKIQAT